MKCVVILFAVTAVVSAAKQETYKLSREVIDSVRKMSVPCAAEYKVDPKLMLKVTDGTMPTDDASVKFLYCTAVKTGYVTEDGHVAVDNVAGLVKDHPLAEEYKEALRKCNEITKETPLATIVVINKCFAKAPIRFVF